MESTIDLLHSKVRAFERNRYVNAKEVDYTPNQIIEEIIKRDLAEVVVKSEDAFTSEDIILSRRDPGTTIFPSLYSFIPAYMIIDVHDNEYNPINPHLNTVILKSEMRNYGEVSEDGFVTIGETLFGVEEGYVLERIFHIFKAEDSSKLASFLRNPESEPTKIPTERLKMFNGGEKHLNSALEQRLQAFYGESDNSEVYLGSLDGWKISFSKNRVPDDSNLFNIHLRYQSGKRNFSILTKSEVTNDSYELLMIEYGEDAEESFLKKLNEYSIMSDYIKKEFRISLPTQKQIQHLLMEFIGTEA